VLANKKPISSWGSVGKPFYVAN